MESFSSKEFFEQLNSDTLKSSLKLKGIVKKSTDDSEVLFSRRYDFGNWIKIPASMIESVRLLKSFTKEGETYAFVKLYLKTPSSAEGKVLHDLLSAEESCGMHGKTCGCHHCRSIFGHFRKFGHPGMFGGHSEKTGLFGHHRHHDESH